MVSYSFSDEKVRHALGELREGVSDLAILLYDALSEDRSDKMRASKIFISVKLNVARFLLLSPDKNFMTIQIDLFDRYYDFFVQGEEIVLQQKINPVERSITFIKTLLSAKAKEVLVEDIYGNVINRQIYFYDRGRKINSAGSVSLLHCLFRRKVEKKVILFDSWL